MTANRDRLRRIAQTHVAMRRTMSHKAYARIELDLLTDLLEKVEEEALVVWLQDVEAVRKRRVSDAQLDDARASILRRSAFDR